MKGILEHHECKNPLDAHDNVLRMTGVSAAYKKRVQSSRNRAEQQFAAIVDGMSNADLQAQGICPPGIPMSEARKFGKFTVDELLNQHGVVGGDRELRSPRNKWISIRR